MNNTLSYHIADYVEGMGNWSHIATVRPPNYRLNETNSSTLMKRLYSDRFIRKVFWVLEKDTSKLNHLHLLLDYIDMDNDMKAIRGRLNIMLGAKRDSQLVGFVDKVEQSKVKGAINYACKYINVNSAYGFEL
tara:strand:+ start:571 stop:969 length:399 start_codon:yes stop_codon:yes gene_type:complete